MKMTLVCLFSIFFENISLSQINPNLSAEYYPVQKQVELKWQNADKRVTGFILQRSSDTLSWKNIYSVNKPDFSRKKQERCTDYMPVNKKIFYRLKIITEDSILFSATIMVITGNTQNSWIMYPVPVTDLLNFQYNGGESIKGVINVFIRNSFGYILLRKRYSSISRNIKVPVDNLGRGIYDINISVNDEIVWSNRFIK